MDSYNPAAAEDERGFSTRTQTIGEDCFHAWWYYFTVDRCVCSKCPAAKIDGVIHRDYQNGKPWGLKD